MATLPAAPDPITERIYAWRASRQDEGFRFHLGASQIGGPCDRALWYGFRWATPAAHSGRILRLFDRGQREEAVFLEELRGIGCEVVAEDDGHQWRVSACGGHVGGSMDGAARGVPGAEKTWHVLECKTHGAKSFREVVAKGVEQGKPQHWAQMQVYMALSRMSRALYLAVNKDTDEIYAERVREDKPAQKRLLARAEAVVFAQEPPARISEDPSWWQCRFCDHRAVCHEGRLPAVTCRSCLHATPESDGKARWSCAAWETDIPDWAAQRAACPRHCFIPQFVAWAQPVDATGSGVIYADAEGNEWEQGPAGIPSVDLARMRSPEVIGHPLVQDALEVFDGAEVTG